MIDIQITAANQGNYLDSASLSIELTLDDSIVDGWISPYNQTGLLQIGEAATIRTTLAIPHTQQWLDRSFGIQGLWRQWRIDGHGHIGV